MLLVCQNCHCHHGVNPNTWREVQADATFGGVPVDHPHYAKEL
jgi:hypothetical protein